VITIPEIFASLAQSQRTAKRPALIGSYTVTFEQLFENAQSRLTQLRSLRIGTGDIVAIISYNEVAFFEYLIATNLLGAALLPLSPALPNRDLHYLLAESQAKHCFISPKMDLAKAKQLEAEFPSKFSLIGQPVKVPTAHFYDSYPSADSVCWISTTGGSTGTPRLFAASHQSLLTNLMINAVEWGWQDYPLHLALAPLSHGIGFCHALGQLITGGTVVLVEKYSVSEAFVERLHSGQMWTAVVPTMLHDVVEYSIENSRAVNQLQLVVSAGSLLSASLRDKVIGSQSERRLIEYYGSTELGWVTWIEHKYGEIRNGLIGNPTLGTLVRVTSTEGKALRSGEIGRIEKRGRPYTVPFVPGLVSIANSFRKEWDTSGDMGLLDIDGSYLIVGREDEMITIGGQNVYPVEIEAVLREHSAVRDALVVVSPNHRLGWEIKAFVEVRGPIDTNFFEHLLDFAAERLPKYTTANR
jgi:acyl-CoA synthetase (AMP-forming)/AMP-acid ligase II